MATIRTRRLFHSELLIVSILFKGVTIQEQDHFCGEPSETVSTSAAFKKGNRLFVLLWYHPFVEL